MSRSIGRDDHSGMRYKKGQWTPEEDLLLIKYIETHGEGKWQTLPQKAGLQRCGKGCRLRWKNYLRPNVKRGNISLEEEDLIIRLHKLLGNRWSLIAGRVPGRTDNEIKNYWNSHLSRKLRRNIILETTNHNRASSSPSDQLHNETLYRYGHCTLPDTKINSQRQGDQLKSNHFDISNITDSQIDPSNHMACPFQRAPHAEAEDSTTIFSQYLSAKHDVNLSSDIWLQQPLPPSDQLYDRNGQVFDSMVAKQPEYCSSSSLFMGSCYDEMWDHNDLGSDIHGGYDEICDPNDMSRTEMQDPLR